MTDEDKELAAKVGFAQSESDETCEDDGGEDPKIVMSFILKLYQPAHTSQVTGNFRKCTVAYACSDANMDRTIEQQNS